MINVIAAAKGKLDNPLMLEWAIRYYSDLPKGAESERSAIEETWFHDVLLAELIESDETKLLNDLLREFPARRLTGFVHLLVKHWPAWPGSLSATVSVILMTIAPDELVRLYRDAIDRLPQGDNEDLVRLSAAGKVLHDAKNEQHRELAEKLAQAVLAWPDQLIQSMRQGSLLELSPLLSRQTLVSLLETALKHQTNPGRREALWKSLFGSLFGRHNYLTEVFDWGRYDSLLRFARLTPFFRDDAPLEQFDQWLAKSPKLNEILNCLQTLGEKSEGCKTVLSLIRDTPTISGKLSGSLQSQLALAACIQGYAKNDLEISHLSLTDTLDLLAVDVAEPRWQQALTEHLRQFELAEVTDGLIDCLQANADDYGGVHIAEVMAELKYPEFTGPLIDAIGEDMGDFLCESAQKALIEIGSGAQAALIERWDRLDMSQQIYGLTVIRIADGQAAADFAVSRFVELLEDEMEFTCELAASVPDQRLLELLKAESRRQQPLIDRAFYTVARLLDHQDAELEAVKARAMADYERSKQLLESWSMDSLPHTDHLSLELECPACGAVNRYQAKGVVLGEGKGTETACLLADEFPCASCDAEVEFKFTSGAILAVTAELLKLQISEYADIIAEPLVRRLDCSLDGKVMSAFDALSIARARLALHPDSAKDWLVWGNLLSPLNRPKAALKAYRKAAQLAPMAIDVQFTLANRLTNSDQLDEAFGILQSTLEHKPQWVFLTPFPDFGHDFADLYNYLRRELKKTEFPLLHASALIPPKKPGRNDPCPCGSGKKYKKCCGR
jgi:tetratricopeptide (TPR) repeat protein